MFFSMNNKKSRKTAVKEYCFNKNRGISRFIIEICRYSEKIGEIFMVNIRKLETELWEAADLLRADSKVTSQEYCMPVLGLIFLRYAYSRFKFVEADILKNRPVRNGRVLPVEPDDFKTKSAIFLPEEARYDYLLNAIATYRQQIYEYVYNTYPAA